MDEARFDRQVKRLGHVIIDRFRTVSDLLHGARALALASDEVTPHEWSVYFQSITR